MTALLWRPWPGPLCFNSCSPSQHNFLAYKPPYQHLQPYIPPITHDIFPSVARIHFGNNQEHLANHGNHNRAPSCVPYNKSLLDEAINVLYWLRSLCQLWDGLEGTTQAPGISWVLLAFLYQQCGKSIFQLLQKSFHSLWMQQAFVDSLTTCLDEHMLTAWHKLLGHWATWRLSHYGHAQTLAAHNAWSNPIPTLTLNMHSILLQIHVKSEMLQSPHGHSSQPYVSGFVLPALSLPNMWHLRTIILTSNNTMYVPLQRPLLGSRLWSNIRGHPGFRAIHAKGSPEALRELRNSTGYMWELSLLTLSTLIWMDSSPGNLRR